LPRHRVRITLVATSQRTQSFFIRKTDWLALSKEVFADCSENHMIHTHTHTTTQCGKIQSVKVVHIVVTWL